MGAYTYRQGKLKEKNLFVHSMTPIRRITHEKLRKQYGIKIEELNILDREILYASTKEEVIE